MKDHPWRATLSSGGSVLSLARQLPSVAVFPLPCWHECQLLCKTHEETPLVSVLKYLNGHSFYTARRSRGFLFFLAVINDLASDSFFVDADLEWSLANVHCQHNTASRRSEMISDGLWGRLLLLHTLKID